MIKGFEISGATYTLNARILLYGADNCAIISNDIHDNHDGVYMLNYNDDYAENNLIKDNYIHNNNYGVHDLRISKGYSSNLINGNNFSYNLYGVFLQRIEGDRIFLKDFYHNGVGVNVWYSEYVYIYVNEFIENSDDVRNEYSSNIFKTTNQKMYIYNGLAYISYLGNYHSKYTEIDANNDGIGDTYTMTGCTDYYPLILTSENYPPPKVKVSTDKKVYVGEDVKAHVTFFNPNINDLTLTFSLILEMKTYLRPFNT